MAIPSYFFDVPRVLDCTVTPIPASNAPTLTVVASVPYHTTMFQFIDGIGQYVGLYQGDVGKEELITIIGGGNLNKTPVNIKAGTRLSVRSLDNVINTGTLCGVFFS